MNGSNTRTSYTIFDKADYSLMVILYRSDVALADTVNHMPYSTAIRDEFGSDIFWVRHENSIVRTTYYADGRTFTIEYFAKP